MGKIGASMCCNGTHSSIIDMCIFTHILFYCIHTFWMVFSIFALPNWLVLPHCTLRSRSEEIQRFFFPHGDSDGKDSPESLMINDKHNQIELINQLYILFHVVISPVSWEANKTSRVFSVAEKSCKAYVHSTQERITMEETTTNHEF